MLYNKSARYRAFVHANRSQLRAANARRNGVVLDREQIRQKFYITLLKVRQHIYNQYAHYLDYLIHNHGYDADGIQNITHYYDYDHNRNEEYRRFHRRNFPVRSRPAQMQFEDPYEMN